MSAFPKSPVYPTEPVFPLSVEQYHQMIESGTLTEDDPVELIEGVLVFKMPKNKAHAVAVSRILSLCVKAIPSGWVVRAQDPITLTDSEPEPDIVVATSEGEAQAIAHPTPSDIALVIEVAGSSLQFDQSRKLRVYARAGIANYWIVNLVDHRLEVYSSPSGEGYASRRDLTLTETVSLPAEIGGAVIDVAALFPPTK